MNRIMLALRNGNQLRARCPLRQRADESDENRRLRRAAEWPGVQLAAHRADPGYQAAGQPGGQRRRLMIGEAVANIIRPAQSHVLKNSRTGGVSSSRANKAIGSSRKSYASDGTLRSVRPQGSQQHGSLLLAAEISGVPGLHETLVSFVMWSTLPGLPSLYGRHSFSEKLCHHRSVTLYGC